MLIRAGSGTWRAQRQINSKVGRRRDEVQAGGRRGGVGGIPPQGQHNTEAKHVSSTVKDTQTWFWLSTQLEDPLKRRAAAGWRTLKELPWNEGHQQRRGPRGGASATMRGKRNVTQTSLMTSLLETRCEIKRICRWSRTDLLLLLRWAQASRNQVNARQHVLI